MTSGRGREVRHASVRGTGLGAAIVGEPVGVAKLISSFS